MSSELSELDSILNIPGDSMTSISMSDDNLFSQHNFSLTNPLDHSFTNDELAKTVQQAIESKFCKIEEVLVHAIQRENVDLHRLLSLNSSKIDGILQHLNATGYTGDTVIGNGFNVCLNKDTQNKVEPVFCEETVISTNGSIDTKEGGLDQRLNLIETRLENIFEHIQLSNKKLGQDLLDLDNNVDQRVEGMEKKLDILSEGVKSIVNKSEKEGSERNRMSVNIAFINDSVTKLSKEVKQSNSTIIKNTNILVKNTAPDDSKDSLKGKGDKRSNANSRSQLTSTKSPEEKSDSKLNESSLSIAQHDNAQLITNTANLLQKTTKLQNSIDQIQKSISSTSSKDLKLRKSIDNINNHIEELQIITKPTNNKRSSPNKPANKTCDKTKKIFSDTSSNSSSEESDESSSDQNGKKNNISVSKQLSTICSGVEEVKEKMNSWLRYSKKAIKNSDDNTNVMLERFLSLGMSLQNSTSEDKVLHEDILKKLGDINNDSVSMQSLNSQGLVGMDEKITKILGTVEDALAKEHSSTNMGHGNDAFLETIVHSIDNKFEDVRQLLNNFTPPPNELQELNRSSAGQVTRFDELKKMVNGVHWLVEDIRNKYHDLFSNTVPVLNQIEKTQNQESKRRADEDLKSTDRLDKIVDLVEGTNNANRRDLGVDENNCIMQVLKAISEMKANQEGDKVLKALNDMLTKNLNDMKGENSKIMAKLNEILKGKSSEKMLQRVCKLVEESKANDISNTKTLSTINSSLQGIKTNNTKLFGQIKEIKTKPPKQDDSIKSSLLTKHTLQQLYDSTTEVMKDMLSEKLEEMKNILSQVAESNLNVIHPEALEKNSHFNLKDEDLQKIVNAIDKHDFFKDLEGSKFLINYFQKPTSSLLNIMKSIESKCLSLESDLNQNQTVVSNMLNDLFTEINQKPSITEIETTQKEVQNLLEESLVNNYLKHASKLFEEVGKQSALQSELLNSIEDLKLLASSTPNTIHDLFPLVENLRGDISKIPDDIGSYMAGLEENLCGNLETKVRGIHKTSLQTIFGRFDTIEQRMAVIRKYVKYGSGPIVPLNQDENTSTTNGTSGTAEQIEKLVIIQNECLDMLKITHPFGNLNKRTSMIKYQTTAKYIFDLLNCLRHIEHVHNGIKTERKKEQELRIATKEGLFNVLPSLENIVLVLKQFKKQRNFNITLLNELCHEMSENIITIKSLNLALPGTVPFKPQYESNEVVKNGGIILNELVKIVFTCIEAPTFNIRRNFFSTRCKKRLGKYFKKGRKKKLFLKDTTHQSSSQSPHSISTLKCDDLCENVLENEHSNILSPQKFNNDTMPSPSQSSSVNLRKRSRNLSSSSDGTIDDDRSQRTVGTSISSRSTAYTPQRNQMKSPSFLPPNSENLSQYRSKQLSQNTLLQTVPSSNARKASKQKIAHVSQTSFSANNIQDSHFSNAFNQEDEITDTSTNATPDYGREENGPKHQQSIAKRENEYSLLNISRKRLKLAQSLSSPNSSQSTTSSTSMPNSKNKSQHSKNR